MERQIPKNVRQIGNVSDTPKIYVEDYVDTFFAQLCEKTGEAPVGAFLVGDMQKTDEEEYVYIYGAIMMHDLKLSGRDYVMDEETWKHAYEDCKQYFEDGEMLGWFVAHAGVPLVPEENTVKLHKKSFPKANTVFIMKDPAEKDEMYYVHKLDDLIEIGGHYTYYEKNPCMQNYMISNRKKNGSIPSETVEDRAAKDFRSIVRTREEQMLKQRSNRTMYALSACLVLLVVIMGVATMNNFDKMKAVQSTLDNLSGTVLSDAGDTKKEESKTQDSSAGEKAGEESGQALEGQASNAGQGIEGETVDPGTPVENAGTDGQPEITPPAENIGEGDASIETGANVISEGTPAGDGNSVPDGSAAGNTESVPVSGGNGSDGVYVVEQGDTLAIISQKVYGDISHVEAICRMNGMNDGNLIYVGQKLLLP